jgi:hypothetical protein
MSKDVPTTNLHWWSSIAWWGVTIVTLVLVDDLLFGPFFWVAAQFSRSMATVFAFLLSFGFQLWLNWAALQPQQGRVAKAMLDRLRVPRKRPEVVAHEASVQQRIVSAASAVATSLLIGGVLPIIFLRDRDVMSVARLRRLSILTASVYSAEFALLHGGYGFGEVLHVVLGWLSPVFHAVWGLV